MKAILLLLATIAFFTLGTTSIVSANSGFNAGRIIDDGIFSNKSSMSADTIQAFLNSKVSACDTWGAQPSEFGGGTRRQWGESRGLNPPYTCLKDYSENGKSSAQIIYDVAQEFTINPQVLIVLLQKEQGLVTDTWPTSTQYKTATGYGCPDTAPCDSQYFGLTNQLRWSGRMFRAILNNSPTWYTPYVLGTNYIQYNPTASCGGSNVNIENRSTQALYNYTPYQPNTGALAAGWGTAQCGAYGNRNFYLYFTSWFGSTTENPKWQWSFVAQKTFLDSNYSQATSSYEPSVQPNNKLYAEITALNTGNQVWNKMTRITTNNPPGRGSIFYDTAWLSNNRPAILLEEEVLPGSIGTFRFPLQAPQTIGTYREYFNLVQDGVILFNELGQHFTINVVNPVAVRNSTRTALNKGEELKKGEYLLSPDTNSVLTLQDDGNLVLLNNFLPVWSSQTTNRGGDRLIFQGDGNIVLYDKAMKPLWATSTDSTDTNRLDLQTDISLVAQKASGGVSWSANTNTPQNQLDTVARKINSSGVLFPGQRIETPDRTRNLILQSDGNLVLYSGSKALWASGTDGKPSRFLAMQSDGHLVLYDNSMKPLWYSRTAGQGPSSLELQSDSNLVIYRNDGRPTWATYTNR